VLRSVSSIPVSTTSTLLSLPRVPPRAASVAMARTAVSSRAGTSLVMPMTALTPPSPIRIPWIARDTDPTSLVLSVVMPATSKLPLFPPSPSSVLPPKSLSVLIVSLDATVPPARTSSWLPWRWPSTTAW
ncbi:hypothetical protein BGZ92_007290, partial [Podila epicladia]